jgi:hypothetical protein
LQGLLEQILEKLFSIKCPKTELFVTHIGHLRGIIKVEDYYLLKHEREDFYEAKRKVGFVQEALQLNRLF